MAPAGNLRVLITADKDFLRVTDEDDANLITYTITVINDSDVLLSNISFTDKLLDGNENLLPTSHFDITEVTATNFAEEPVLSTTNVEISGTLSLAPRSTGVIKVTGRLQEVPPGRTLRNSSSVSSGLITEEFADDNTAIVNTLVAMGGGDLVVEQKEVDNNLCLDGEGNRFTLTVRNIGEEELVTRSNSDLRIAFQLPAGADMSDLQYDGWDLKNNGRLEISGEITIESGGTLPPISFTLHHTETYTTNGAVLSLTPSNQEDGSNNNSAPLDIKMPPQAPETSPVYYCLGDNADPLTATADTGNRLRWYKEEEDTYSSMAYTPSTATPGETIYYVSQYNGECESELVPVHVYVLGEPTPGSIAGSQEVCRNASPQEFTSTLSGSLPAPEVDKDLFYRWEVWVPASNSWEAIAEATAETYEADAITEETKFRRITVVEAGGIRCESEPTDEVLVTIKPCAVSTNPMMPSRGRSF